MSASAEFQKLVYDHLRTDPAVTQHVADRIYDGPRPGASAPYISFGPSDTIDDSATCIDAIEETMQIDIWTEEHGRLVIARRITDSVRKSLKALGGAMPDPYAFAGIVNIVTRVLPDPDGITAHGIVTVTARIEGE